MTAKLLSTFSQSCPDKNRVFWVLDGNFISIALILGFQWVSRVNPLHCALIGRKARSTLSLGIGNHYYST